MRRLICILLLMCLPLHSFATQGGALLLGSNASIAHELEHDEGLHHHHDDGSVHYDDSDESHDHIQDHSASSPQPAGLSVLSLPTAPPQLISSLKIDFSHFIPEPFLDGPLRPPSLTLG